jgi:hypothetical protein
MAEQSHPQYVLVHATLQLTREAPTGTVKPRNKGYPETVWLACQPGDETRGLPRPRGVDLSGVI